jgi:hypothetical protein
MTTAEIELRSALQAIALAAELLKPHRELIDRYFAEANHMDSFGPIFEPTLFKNPERRRVDEALRPALKATADFVDAIAKAQGAVTALQP